MFACLTCCCPEAESDCSPSVSLFRLPSVTGPVRSEQQRHYLTRRARCFRFRRMDRGRTVPYCTRRRRSLWCIFPLVFSTYIQAKNDDICIANSGVFSMAVVTRISLSGTLPTVQSGRRNDREKKTVLRIPFCFSLVVFSVVSRARGGPARTIL